MANQPSKYSKFLLGAASAALVASAVAPAVSAADFSDTKGNTHQTAIDALSAAGIISGYPDGSFQPNKTLTRSDVVKLMGKWLVSLGNEVPTDYKTNIRFTDLSATSNDELLQYSALVYDKGVFIGNAGKLDAAGNISRENMAMVLVRAFDSLNGTDLVATVKEAKFDRDVTDLAKAKAEAQPYIDVLDFYDITNPAAPAFNPKGTTTRGQFASFLHKTANLDANAEMTFRITAVTGLNDTNQFLQIDFSKAVTSLEASDISIKDSKSNDTYGVKDVKLASNGLSAQVELFVPKENEQVLKNLTDYTITVRANHETLTYVFNRPEFLEQRVVDVDLKNNRFTIQLNNSSTKTIEVRDTFEGFKELDLYSLLGEEVRVWYDDKNRLVDYKVADASAKIDAVEIKGTDEIKLLGEDKTYDISDDKFTNSDKSEVFAFYVNGKKISNKDGEIPTEYKGKKYNYAKVGFDDSGDAAYVSVYNLGNFLVVDKVEKNEVVGYKGDGTGGSFNAKDATIVKEGKAIKVDDLKQGDILFFNKDADKDGFAEVLNKTVSGKIDSVFSDSVRIDGKTYKFKDNVGIKDFSLDYATAVYLDDDGETALVDSDAAEELQAAGAVALYTDRAGHVVYIGGDTANVERNTLVSILTANIAADNTFNRDRIEIEAVYSTGEEKLFEVVLKDLKSIIVDGTTYDIDNGAKTKWTAKVNGNQIVLSDNTDKKSDVKVSLGDTKRDVVKLHLDKNRSKLEKLEFFTSRSKTVTKANLEKGDSYVDGKKLNSKTVVFNASKFTNNVSDIKTTTWGDYTGGKISDVTYVYDKNNEVVGLVINENDSSADTLEEALITDVLRNTDNEIVEVTVFMAGKKQTIKVDEVVAPEVVRGGFAVLVFDDKNYNLVEKIISTNEFKSNDIKNLGTYAFKGAVKDSGVDVGKREVTVNGQTFKLASDGLVIDARDKNDIKTKSLTDLRGKDVIVIRDEVNSDFIKFVVYGGITEYIPTLGEGSTEVTKTALNKAIEAAEKAADTAIAGSEVGQYPQKAIDTYKEEIKDAKKVADDSKATQVQVDAAEIVLEKATKAFDAAKVTEVLPEGITITSTTVEAKDLNLFGLHMYNVEGTLAGADVKEAASVEIFFDKDLEKKQVAEYDAATGKFTYEETLGLFKEISIIVYDKAGKTLVSQKFPVVIK